MSKRVSLKGRGADLFFGGEETAETVSDGVAVTTRIPDPEQPEPEALASGDNFQASQNASMQAREEAGVQESGLPGTQDCSPADSLVTAAEISPSAESWTPATLIDAIWAQLCDRAAVTNAFRYTDRELSWLTDVLYEVNKRYGLKVSKQDVARLGLLAVLHDYEERGEVGLLGAFVRRRQRERGQS